MTSEPEHGGQPTEHQADLPDHIPVLPEETLEALAPQPGETYVDLTTGLGGHAILAAAQIGPDGVLVLNDTDRTMLDRAIARVREACGQQSPRIETVHGNFSRISGVLAERGLRANAVLADLGFSSAQMDDGSRGFSFRREGPLDMRLDGRSPISAAELVAESEERELRDILKRYGEEPMAAAIARKIVETRAEYPILTTGDLANLVRDVTRCRRRGSSTTDPATRTFQALRIAVNDELGSLERLLGQLGRGTWLAPGCRFAAISFHSLEDRIVKRAFAEAVSSGGFEFVVRHPVEAGEAEINQNRRSRSAKLRCVRVTDVA